MKSLDAHLRQKIDSTGPLTVADFMSFALYDPKVGYYTTKVPIGRQGDYITAPEITQVFGEVIALWFFDIWQKAGQPTPFNLIEMGPGRGTLMSDILRTMVSLKTPAHEIKVHLIEISPTLRNLQKAALSSYKSPLNWHQDLSFLSDCKGFSLIIGNEFWDALPIQQHVKVKDTWIERKVGLKANTLSFLPEESDIIKETCPAMPSLVSQLSHHLKSNGGAALFLDYGYSQPEALGDTLQAIHNHQKQSPLITVGQADLTHHVDFNRLSSLFQKEGLSAYGPISQGDFLKAIGLELRTEHLCSTATPEQQSLLRTGCIRLIHPSQMGTLFKVIALTNSPSLKPAGFEVF